MAEEPEYGNHILYAEIHNPVQATADFTLEYEVTRHEFSRGDYAQLERKDTKPGVVLVSMQRYVEPDKLIPTTARSSHWPTRSLAVRRDNRQGQSRL